MIDMGRVGSKKSRNGCTRCKHRRVKCDEVRPSCGWCASHSSECEYPDIINQDRIRASSSSSSPMESDSCTGHPSAIPLVSTAVVDTDQAQLELGLFQYYVYTVARNFPYLDKERGLELHADIIPQASLRCVNLLNVIYSYALLHMHIQSSIYGILPRNVEFFSDAGLRIGHSNNRLSEQQADLFSLHRDYLDRALQGQRDVVSEINHKNADGICIAAVLLAQVALVHSSQIRLAQGYCIPADWFRLQSSFSTCLAIARPLLGMDSATSMMIHSPPSIDNRDLDHQSPRLFRDIMDWQPVGSTDRITYQTRETYRRCIVYIETIWKRIAEKEPWQSLGRRILAFPAVGLSTFLALLEAQQPRALVILAHLLAMTKRLDNTWWIFKGVADHHVRGIATLVPDEWQWAMQWPMKVVETGAADECFQAERSPGVIDELATPL